MTARSEDRGVQVEARTLSGVHIGQRVEVSSRGEHGLLAALDIDIEVPNIVGIRLRNPMSSRSRRGQWLFLAPTDLVTLTDGGAS